MKKGTKYSLYISVILLIAIGGYFLSARFGFLSKEKVVYVQPSSEAENVETPTEPIAATESSAEMKSLENEKTPVVEKQEVKIVKEVPVKNEEKDIKKEDETSNNEVGKIVDKLITWGFQKSDDRKIDTMIIHSSYDALGNDPYSVSGIIDEYKQYGVSAHYLIARDGIIYRLVADKNIAWHAGVSKMPDGRTNVNDFSIGVEMINTMDGEYTSDQYDALNQLIASLKKKYSIKYILGHDDIAPGRKTDPWGIDWDRVRK